MKKLIFFLLLILAACAPSEEAIQTAVAGTLTAAPTATTTPQPTYTKTVIPTATLTPGPAATAAAESISGQEGWIQSTVDGFSIALPEGWEAVDIGEEGLASVLTLVEGLDGPLGETILEMLSSSGDMASIGMTGALKFVARDASPEASGNAMAAVLNQSLPFPMGGSMLCMFLPTILEKAGLVVVDSQCGLELNGMEGGMFETQVNFGETPYRQQLYYYMDGGEVWILLSGVEEAAWETYRPVIADIAKSFKVGTAAP